MIQLARAWRILSPEDLFTSYLESGLERADFKAGVLVPFGAAITYHNDTLNRETSIVSPPWGIEVVD